jgi:hypothetical protein
MEGGASRRVLALNEEDLVVGEAIGLKSESFSIMNEGAMVVGFTASARAK